MNPGDIRITVETLSAGQQGSYSDAIYRNRYTIENISCCREHSGFGPAGYSRELVEQWVRGFQNWTDNPGPFDTRLESFKEISKGVWEVVTRTPFTD